MIRHRSKKTEAKYRLRRKLVTKFMAEHPLCMKCLAARSTDPHEPLTRARGGSILDEENLVALCGECHSWVHNNPKQAAEEGWLRSGKKQFSFRS